MAPTANSSYSRTIAALHKRYLLLLVTSWALGGCFDDNGLPSAALLSDLQISGTKTALNPAFDPNIFRYSVIASDVPSGVLVTASAPESMLLSINGALTSSGVSHQLDALNPGDVVRIGVEPRGLFGTHPDETVERNSYEIVYLPTDFPELTVTVLEDGVSPQPLYVNLNGPNSSYVAVLNNHGVPRFFRREDQRVFDFKWHEATGERSYARRTGTRNEWGRRNAEYVLLDADYNEIRTVTTVELSHTDNHDFLVLPNGNFILLSYDGTVRDLTPFGGGASEVVEDSVVQEIDRAGNVIFQWNSWGKVPYEDQTRELPSNEYAHFNSLFLHSDGHLIVSARHTSQVVKIARPSGTVLWKLGGRTNQFRFINDPYAHLCGQHTASWLQNGNLLIFDNGQYCWPVVAERGEETRVVEYRIDESNLEAELVWSYTQPGAYTRSQGSAQRLANGNTLIGWGRGPDLLATEVNSAGEKVFEITALDDGVPVIGYRALRFPQ